MRRGSSFFTLQTAAQCAAPSLCVALVHFLHCRGLPNASCHLYASRLFEGVFWRPSWCQNWVPDSSLESLFRLLSNATRIVQFGVHFPCQKSNFPRAIPRPIWTLGRPPKASCKKSLRIEMVLRIGQRFAV